ncbi:hypothetical protein [Blastococcus sp. VKM Ac-2987]|uniref:hypothetical protein n=1 Tax=Blastococcus sp. VKM Ac-2987 TaxID=3004141 RepID=UPI0022ABB864|nr:hypothetical protein [Blastococcus sp. VKM Ac-2987]MCZ2859207.1 hypothetical protein [Blastococcus sp. VKM Ac-2987]
MPGELMAVLAPLVGCCALIAVVVALGASSTARYEFERNAVQNQQRAAAPAPAAARTGAVRAVDGAGPEQPAAERTAVGLATHPAGRHLADGPPATGWWLVGEPGGEAVAGPFADRLDAEWALVSEELPGTADVVHGARRADGGVARRQSVQERAWLAELGRQLDRLPADWDPLMDDDDSLTTLAVDVSAALVEAGLPLHDCEGADPAGGVCLTPHPAGEGVLVTWHQHDRMSLQQVRGGAMDTAVQRTMTAAVGTLLRQLGFPVEEFGSTGCHLVSSPAR